MAPSVCPTAPDTPSLPLPPMPLGHATVLPRLCVAPPRAVTQLGLSLVRKSVKMSVVPEPSERWTVAMGSLGNVTVGFSLLMAGSSHDVCLLYTSPSPRD